MEEFLEKLTPDKTSTASSAYIAISKATDSNFVISPLLMEMVLTLIQFGARDKTAQEIRIGLNHRECTQKVIESVMGALARTLSDFNEQYMLRNANKIYINKDFKIKEHFQKSASATFNIDLVKVDFSKVNEVVKKIDEWVLSFYKIQPVSLIKPNDVSEAAATFVISMLKFNAMWCTNFAKSRTSHKDFYVSPTKTIEVEMIEDTSVYNYFESPKLKATLLEVFLKGSDASLGIVLPNEKENFGNVENMVNVALHVAAKDFTKQNVSVSIPKFQIENRIDFKKVLQKLEIFRIIAKTESDLSLIAGNKNELFVSEIVQRIFFQMEAAAPEGAYF